MCEKLVSVTTPAVPMWAIYYVEGAPDDFQAWPIVALAVIEEKAGDIRSRIIRPLVYDRETGFDDWFGADDALGYLLGDEVSKAKEIFAAAIAREKGRSG